MATYPTYISLCSGGGGLDAGLRLAEPRARAICYLERDITEAGVLAKGIETGWVDDAPVWSDLLSFDARAWRGLVDGVIGGFPCQPHSFAGKRLGEHDERNLWPDVARIVWESQASWVFFENVPGILGFYWREVRPVLRGMGFEVAEGIFSAEEVGAPHLRERLFWLAYRGSSGRWAQGHEGESSGGIDRGGAELAYAGHDAGSAERGLEQEERPAIAGRRSEPLADAEDLSGRQRVAGQRLAGRTAARGAGEVVGDAECDGRRGGVTGRTEPSRRAFPPGPSDADGWARWLGEWPGTEPALRRDADGLASRSDRLRVLGNGVVPLAAANAYLTLKARLEVRA